MELENGRVQELAELIVKSVNLHHINPQDLNENTSLTEGGLGLDSVDILEIVVTVEQKYGVKLASAQEGKEVFRNLGTVARFIEAHQKH